jgi:hypothetical protein
MGDFVLRKTGVAGSTLRGGDTLRGTDAGGQTYTLSQSVDARLYGWEPPLNLVATAVSTSEIDLTWTATPGATEYFVYRDGVQIAWTTNAYYDDTGLTADTLYTYRVRAAR